jgi:hypothetical protein
VLMNLIWGREEFSVPLWSNKNLYTKWSQFGYKY